MNLVSIPHRGGLEPGGEGDGAVGGLQPQGREAAPAPQPHEGAAPLQVAVQLCGGGGGGGEASGSYFFREGR